MQRCCLRSPSRTTPSALLCVPKAGLAPIEGSENKLPLSLAQKSDPRSRNSVLRRPPGLPIDVVLRTCGTSFSCVGRKHVRVTATCSALVDFSPQDVPGYASVRLHAIRSFRRPYDVEGAGRCSGGPHDHQSKWIRLAEKTW